MRLVCSAIVLIALAGCDSKPRAPALLDEPVYENDVEGFRFLAPEGWSLRGKAVLPPGPVTQERLLVVYQQLAADQGATLEVLRFDVPETTDLAAYLAGASYGTKQWTLKRPAEELRIGPAAARRFLFAATQGKAEMLKDVVVFQRGGRYYFFTGLYWANDDAARDQIQRAVESTIWKS